MLLQVLGGPTLQVDLGTRPRPSHRPLYLALACLTIGLLGFAAYLYQVRSGLHQPRPNLPPSAQPDLLALGEKDLRLGQQAYQRKDWAQAQKYGQSAHDLIVSLGVSPPARVKQVQQFHLQSTTRYAQVLMERSLRHLKANQIQPALADCRVAQRLFGGLPKMNRQHAETFALEGKIFRRAGNGLAANTAFQKAHQLDPQGPYLALQQKVIPASAPAAAPPLTAPPAPVSLSIGEAEAYPSGRKVPRRPVQPVARVLVTPEPVAASKRVSTSAFVARKKPEKRRDLHADELPSYNDGK
jgi:tetratricopeptide (TPR) repeat protein